MIVCPRCGKGNEESCYICIYCGWRLRQPTYNQVQSDLQQLHRKENAKRVRNGIISGVILLLLLVGLMVGALFLSFARRMPSGPAYDSGGSRSSRPQTLAVQMIAEGSMPDN